MDLVTLQAGLDLAKVFRDWLPKGRDDRALQEQICTALRTFYFTPRGVVALLQKIDAGEKVSRAELSEALLEFNDGEPAVLRASEQLRFERLQRELGISLRTIQTLEVVRWGKLTLRREIQHEINYYGVSRTKPDKDKIKALLGEIETLNSLILEVEEAVNAAGKSSK